MTTDKALMTSRLLGAIEGGFNPACFNFDESEARQRGLWRDPRPMPTQEELDAAQVDYDKEASSASLYEAMVSDIYAKMLEVFGTNNDVSAQAFAATYEAMAKRPANYVGEFGLVDEAAVLNYANAKIAEADAYAIFRMNRIEKFKADKAAL